MIAVPLMWTTKDYLQLGEFSPTPREEKIEEKIKKIIYLSLKEI